MKKFFSLLSLLVCISIGQVWATDYYVKVTSAPSDWAGDYLIVYESGKVAFDGSLSTLDAVGNTKAVTINNGKIEATAEMNAIKFTISADASESGWYQLKSASGYYIAGTQKSSNASNGLKSTNTENSKSNYINQPGVGQILSKSADQNMTLRYNSASNQTRFRYYKSGQQAIALYKFEAGTTTACATPTFTPAAGAVLSGTTVAISCATDGATIHYTTDGTTPTASSPTYSSAITIDAAKTIKAIAVKSGLSNSSVASASYTIATPLTTMDAIYSAATTAGTTATDVYITFNNWVVTAVKSSNAYVTDGTKGFIIYASGHGFAVGNILSGTVACKVQLYNGAAELTNLTSSTTGITVTTGGTASVNVLDATGIGNLSGVNTGSLIKISGECTETSSKFYIGGVQLYNSLYSFSVSAGTSYECTGVYVQYNSTKEILPRSAADIVVSSSIAVTGVDLTESTAEVEVGEKVTLHASILPENATNKGISWSVQSGSDKASVANGVVTGIATGEAVIRATSDADNTKYAECTVTVKAADPTKHHVMFDATVDKTTEDTELSITKSNVTIAVTEGDGRFNNGTDYRPYKNAVFTVSCSDGNITKIEFTCTTSKPITGFADLEGLDKTNEVWTGNAASVSFTASGAQVQIQQLEVTYKDDTRADAEISFEQEEYDAVIGEDFEAPELQNEHNVTVTYSSSDEDLALVDESTGEVLIGETEGTVTITATFAGDATYKPATASYDIVISATAPVVLTDYYEKVTSTANIVEGTYLIVYEEGNVAFNGGLESLDAESNTIAVEITNDKKIGVTEQTAAATFYIDPTAGTIKSASNHYIGVSSWSNGLKQTETYVHNVLEIDGDENAQVGIYNASWNTTGGTMRLQYNKSTGQTRFRYYKNGGQQPIALYKLHGETIKDSPELAWSGDVEMTVGGEFTSPTLSHAAGITGTITYSSDKEAVATVDANGVISLVADATGTAKITASYPGDENFKDGSAVCTIKVNPAHSIYVSPSLTVNFGSIAQNATVEDKVITVTLTAVDAATVVLSGNGASAFSFTPDALTASGNITISASTATIGTFEAKLTISDDAGLATSRDVTLKLAVTDPDAEETPISTSTKWVPATEISDGMQVLVTGVKDEVVYAMGEQKSTNRAAYSGTLDGDVFTPGEGTMAFTLVAQDDGTYAIRTSNGKYLYAAASGSNHLKTQDEVDVNAKWTLTVSSAVAEGSSNRNIMRFNGSGDNKLFSCYSSGQTEIKFYVPKPIEFEPVRENLEVGRHYTACLEKKIVAVQGATIWGLSQSNSDKTVAYLVEAELPLAAGTPFIYQTTATTFEVAYEGNAVGAPIESGALRGTFNGMTSSQLEALTNVYLMYQNAFHKSGTGNTLGEHRAYLLYDELEVVDEAPQPAPGRRVKGMTMQGNVTTDIEDAEASAKPMKKLIDGQLFILCGEKLYDATGRQVK